MPKTIRIANVLVAPLLLATFATAQYDWRISPGLLPASGGGMARGPVAGNVVRFGGLQRLGPGNFVEVDRTLTWNGVAWSEQQVAVRPPARSSAMLAYDAARQVTVMHGGSDQLGNALSDTWEWDGALWTQVATANVPPARRTGAMAFDGSNVVLFGGEDNGTVLGDTWVYDGVDWTLRAVTAGPSARSGHVMAAGPGEVLLFSGTTQTTNSDETWRWDGNGWSELAPATSPSWRILAAMAYHPQRGAYVLHGGLSPLPNGTTWTFDGSDWQEITSNRNPNYSCYRTMAYHAPTGRLVATNTVGSPNPANSAVTTEWGYELAYMRPVGVTCAPVIGSLLLRRVAGQPRPGETFRLDVKGVAGIGLFTIGFSDTVGPGGTPLPMSLAAIGGAASCFLRNSADVLWMLPPGPEPLVDVTVPNLTGLVGLEFHVQGFDWAGSSPASIRTTQMFSCGIDWN